MEDIRRRKGKRKRKRKIYSSTTDVALVPASCKKALCSGPPRLSKFPGKHGTDICSALCILILILRWPHHHAACGKYSGPSFPPNCPSTSTRKLRITSSPSNSHYRTAAAEDGAGSCTAPAWPGLNGAAASEYGCCIIRTCTTLGVMHVQGTM